MRVDHMTDRSISDKGIGDVADVLDRQVPVGTEPLEKQRLWLPEFVLLPRVHTTVTVILDVLSASAAVAITWPRWTASGGSTSPTTPR